MVRQYDLILTNQRKTLWLGLGGFYAITGLCAVIAVRLSTVSSIKPEVAIWGLMLVWGTGCYALYRLTKKTTGEPTFIAIEEDRILLLNRRLEQQTQLQFEDIKSYRYATFRGSEELVFKLKNGRKEKLSVGSIHNDRGFNSMVRCFESAFKYYQQ